ELTVSRTPAGGGVALTVHGPDLGPADDNLAVRAARAVLDATGHTFGVALELTKRIPVRAGLGGGSSDAAATLHAVNALAGDAVPRPELLHCAARLGADVAFCASGAPAAVAGGRGERLFRPTHPYWVRLCGSGSAVAAVYASERLRDDARMQLGEKHQQLIGTTTRAVPAAGPEPLP